METYDSKKTIAAVPVCAAYHGGPLDYPKAVSKAVSEIITTWVQCFSQTQRVLEREGREKKPENDQEGGEQGQGNSDEEVYEKLTGNTIPAKRTKPSEIRHATPMEEEFFSAVSESSTKICAHSIAMVKKLLVNGDMAGLLTVLGSLALARNKIWFYNETIIIHPKCVHPFTDNYKELSELVESTAEQIVNYQMSLAATTVLHDASSQNWTESKPFYEGERISHSVQMWWYYLQGLQFDLWNSVPPKIAANMFGKIFDSTYSILVGRYTKVTPSTKRLPQYRGDITAILLIASEVLTFIAHSSGEMLGQSKPKPFGGQNVWNLHCKSRLLFNSLALVGSPLHALYKSALDCLKPKLKNATLPPLENGDNNAIWLHMIRPGIFHTPNPELLSAESHLVILAKLAANQASPSWPLIVQVLLSHNMMVAKVILLHFGAFVPRTVQQTKPEQSEEAPSTMIDGCKGFECRKKCIGPADVNWPQAVGSGVLKIILDGGIGGKDCLSLALENLFDRMSGSSWEAVNQTQLWNSRRPVWLQAIIHLVEPHTFPAVLELLDLVDSGRTWTLNQVQTAMKEVLTCLDEMIPIIPVPIIRLCMNNVQNRLPHGVEPLNNCVFTHILICALYDVNYRLQNVLQRENCPKEKVDFIIAFGEALVNLDSRSEVSDLTKTAKKVLEEADEAPDDHTDEDDTIFDQVLSDYSFILAEKVAGEILQDEDGKFALKALHRYAITG